MTDTPEVEQDATTQADEAKAARERAEAEIERRSQAMVEAQRFRPGS